LRFGKIGWQRAGDGGASSVGIGSPRLQIDDAVSDQAVGRLAPVRQLVIACPIPAPKMARLRFSAELEEV
jgi:hypothetical protein